MNIPIWLKPALYGAAAGAVVVAIVGFSWGGWVTGGTAAQAATDAGDQSRADLAGAVCVQNFLGGEDAREQLALLQAETSTTRQRQFVVDGGWSTMPDREETGNQAATLCARMLGALEPIELPVVEDGEVVEPGAVIEEVIEAPAAEAVEEPAAEPVPAPEADAVPEVDAVEAPEPAPEQADAAPAAPDGAAETPAAPTAQ